MCKTIKNTRWLCHSTRRCIPTNPYLPSTELRPAPFTQYYDKADGFTRACHGKREVDCSTDRIFYKSLECPKHHRKRLANLDEFWNVGFQIQVIDARPDKAYRRAAEAGREMMSMHREMFLRGLEAEAGALNAEFYAVVLAWQVKVITQVKQDLVGNRI